MPRHIAIVEDEDGVRENYQQALEREGYTISTYKNRAEAQEAFNNQLPDLAILDIRLGNERDGGFTLCRFLRAKSDRLPIIFLSGLGKDMERVSGMRLGAIDYMLKGTTTLDFLPVRVSALFHYLDVFSKPTNNDNSLVRGQLTLYVDRMEITWDNTPIHFTLTEFMMIQALVKRPGNPKSNDQLMQAANTYVSDNAVVATISRIRRKFKEVDPTFDCIQTVYGMGYRWVKSI